MKKYGGAEFPENLISMTQWTPSRSFVSCWHVSKDESAALWRIYGSSEGSIAIVSSVGSLEKIFPEKIDTIGDVLVNQAVRMVQYIDYRSEHPHLNDMMGPLCYKRRAFSHEQEVRVIRQEFPTGPSTRRPNGRAVLMGDPQSRLEGTARCGSRRAIITKVVEGSSSRDASTIWADDPVLSIQLG